MRTAIAASERVRGTTTPNPPVGALILDPLGVPVGVGATSPPGGPHAEVNALARPASGREEAPPSSPSSPATTTAAPRRAPRR